MAKIFEPLPDFKTADKSIKDMRRLADKEKPFFVTGAMLVTLLWELAKHLFTFLVKNIGYIGTIYGSLTTFILFLLWMYYLSCIFLLGGQFVNNLSNKEG